MGLFLEKYMYRYLINWALYLITNLWEILFIFLGVRGCHQRWVYCHHGNPQMSEIHDNSPRETTVGGHCHRTGRTWWTLCSKFLCLQSFYLTSFKIIVLKTLIQQFIPKNARETIWSLSDCSMAKIKNFHFHLYFVWEIWKIFHYSYLID